MIAFHVATASLALLLGAFVFLLPKGTALHRKIGYGYVAAMTVASVSALFLHRFNGGFSLFHALAIFTLLNLALGILTIRHAIRTGNRKLIRRHYGFLAGSYVAPVSALAAQFLPDLLPMDRRSGVLLVVLVSAALGTFVVRYFAGTVGRRYAA
jgi:uncharacterized membrane protein